MALFRLGGLWTDTVTLGSGSVRCFRVFFCLKDLIHTTKCQNELLNEQTQLQEDISKWMARLESCQKETETKEQQVQQLQDEIRESKLRLDQQEMVLCSEGYSLPGALGFPPPHPGHTAHVHLLWDSLVNITDRLLSHPALIL